MVKIITGHLRTKEDNEDQGEIRTKEQNWQWDNTAAN
jgi:hypothetical protein